MDSLSEPESSYRRTLCEAEVKRETVDPFGNDAEDSELSKQRVFAFKALAYGAG